MKRLKADITAGVMVLPKTAGGKPIALQENNDAGNHQFAIIVSENRSVPYEPDELIKAIRSEGFFEAHIVDVRFVT